MHHSPYLCCTRPNTHSNDTTQDAHQVTDKWPQRNTSPPEDNAEEDQKLTEAVSVYGARKWTSLASKSGLNWCAKSCRLRWVHELSETKHQERCVFDREEDLIIRMHKLLGNRWSLIAGRIPGRTDNDIKNYWNTRLSKKIHQKEKLSNGANSTIQAPTGDKKPIAMNQEYCLSSQVGTSAALIRKEVMINPENYSDTEINNFDDDDFFNLYEEHLSWEVPQIP